MTACTDFASSVYGGAVRRTGAREFVAFIKTSNASLRLRHLPPFTEGGKSSTYVIDKKTQKITAWFAPSGYFLLRFKTEFFLEVVNIRTTFAEVFVFHNCTVERNVRFDTFDDGLR